MFFTQIFDNSMGFIKNKTVIVNSLFTITTAKSVRDILELDREDLTSGTLESCFHLCPDGSFSTRIESPLRRKATEPSGMVEIQGVRRCAVSFYRWSRKCRFQRLKT